MINCILVWHQRKKRNQDNIKENKVGLKAVLHNIHHDSKHIMF